MFGLWRRKVPKVHAHWYVPLKDFRSDIAGFYSAVTEEINRREIPDLEIREIPFSEGGWLSANRIYLRMRREKLVFDVCSAPFGTGWYFSCRGAMIPTVLRWWELFVALVLVGQLGLTYWWTLGTFWGSVAMGASVVAVSVFFINAGRWQSLDDALLQLPVIGSIYEALFRRETYYRQDARLMYLDVVNEIVRTKAAEFALAGGVEKPLFIDLTEPPQPKGFIELGQDFLIDQLKQLKEREGG